MPGIQPTHSVATYSGYSRETQSAAPETNWADKNRMLQLQMKILTSSLADRKTKDFALCKVFTNLKQVTLAKLQAQQGRNQGSNSSHWGKKKKKKALYHSMPGCLDTEYILSLL